MSENTRFIIALLGSTMFPLIAVLLGIIIGRQSQKVNNTGPNSTAINAKPIWLAPAWVGILYCVSFGSGCAMALGIIITAKG